MEKMNRFQFAAKNKIRFNFNGSLSVEDLYDLSLVNLNELYKQLCKERHENNLNESLLDNEETNDLLETKIFLVGDIFRDKKAEKDAKLTKAQNASQLAKVREVLAQKQNAALFEKSEAELLEMLDKLS